MPHSADDKPTTVPAFAPVPRSKERSNGWKPEVQRAFIEALAETGSVKAACRRVGRADHGAYILRRHPEAVEFRRAWDAALDIGMRRIEDVAMDRALNGVDVPVYSYGKLVGSRTVYNDRLLMFMLRNRAPERFPGGMNASGAKGMNAVGQMELNRLKKQLRKELEEEQEAKAPSAAEVRASIDRTLAAIKARTIASTSPAEFELHIATLAQRRADEAAGWRAREPYAPCAAKAAELLPRFIEEVRAEYPPYEEYVAWQDEEPSGPTIPVLPLPVEEPEPEPERRRVRKLTDDGW